MINEPVIREMAPERYRICWSAIFCGGLIGLGLGFLLHLYGIAISLNVFTASASKTMVLVIGGLLGMLVGVIASMATAGFVAGYLGRYHYYHIKGGVIYGFTTWSVILLMSAILSQPLMHYETKYSESLILSSASPSTVQKNSTVNPANDQALPVPALSAAQLNWSGWVLFSFSLSVPYRAALVPALVCAAHEKSQQFDPPIFPALSWENAFVLMHCSRLAVN